MKINVLFSPLQADELYFTGKTTVIIDVLRATTTIITALSNGAKEVIPVNSVEFAMKVSGNFFGGQTLLSGERNTRKIEGFNLGNSPLEYTKEAVHGKSIVLFTTNGSRAIVKAKFSETLVMCAFINLNAVAKYCADLDKDLEIVCAGKSGGFCIEDSLCAGKLIYELLNYKKDLKLTDAAKASLTLNDIYGRNIVQTLIDSEHGQLLTENGFAEDINFCSRLAVSEVIPFFSGGSIKPLNLPVHPISVEEDKNKKE